MRPRRTCSAFTLVELLVVITIIVVLLALLAPAMDQAIYQAELTVCASRQKAALGSVTIYATNHGRRYPYRIGVQNPEGIATNQSRLSMGSSHLSGRTNPMQSFDERPVLRPYMDINRTLNDPLTHAIDLETDDPETTVFSPYDLWWGWQFSPLEGGRGSFKIGDRIEWRYPDDRGNNQIRHWNLSLLIADRNVKAVIAPINYNSSHPDQSNVLVNLFMENQYSPAVILIPTAGKMSRSEWAPVPLGLTRGLLDSNYGYQDGSVRRFHDVKDTDNGIDGDARMTWTFVANAPNGGPLGGANVHAFVPRE
jgi:prepilin-type N-terminal cleavage/methylation domain-containing protein